MHRLSTSGITSAKMWQFENKNATKMKTSQNEMPDMDKSFRRHSLSPRSLSAIFFHSTGLHLDDGVAQWLSINVKEDITNLLNEAGKYMRRIRDRRLQLSHIQHAVRMHDDLCYDIFFRLVHCDDCKMPPSQKVLKTVREAVTAEKRMNFSFPTRNPCRNLCRNLCRNPCRRLHWSRLPCTPGG